MLKFTLKYPTFAPTCFGPPGPTSAESCHQTCMTYTSAEYTVENSWWWTEELPETCRFSSQNMFGKLVRLLVLLKRNL